MLDARDIRSNFEEIKTALSKRNKDFHLENFLELDEKRRELIQKSEDMKSKQNAVSKQVPILKKEGKDASKILVQMKELADEIKEIEPLVKVVDDEIEAFLMNVPNTPNALVPKGVTEDDNVEIRRHGEPRQFDFEHKPHWVLGAELGILDPESASKTTGARFTFLRGAGARLDRALVNFMLNTHTEKHGYFEIAPPFLVHRRAMIGTGQLPKFEEDAFKVMDTEYFLVPTAEVPVTNIHREEIIEGDKLPIKYCAFTACFRAEAGSAGRDTRGLIRQHQFNKVELVKFAKPEDSYEELEKLTADAEEILKLLGLPYRTIRLCAGDLGFCSAMTYDIEVWMPSYEKYVEISSCSNFEAYQARRANIKYKNSVKDKAKYLHTLNGSGLAVGRTIAAIMENYQNADGSISIPDVLVPYMGGDKIIKA